MSKKGRRASNEERLRAVAMLEQGKSVDLIAEILGVGRSTIFEWQAKYRSGGLAALNTKFASGRPAKLSDRQMVQLYSLIVGKDPRQYSLGFALWTREMVAELIHRQFGIQVSLVTVSRILKRLGMSPQRPVYRAYQADPKKVKDWQERAYPALRAEAAREGAKIFFADEAGVRTDYHSGTTWAPVGQTPVVTATGERRSVNMVSAVSPVGELHFRVFEGKMNSETFIEYLRALLDDIPGKIFLVVDGASAHKSRATKAFVASTEGRLTLFLLPPYSPQLNPDEWVWSNVKSGRIGRSVAMSKGHLRQLAEAALQRLQSRPDIVRGFFGDRHLAYISAT
jgi:transposase